MLAFGVSDSDVLVRARAVVVVVVVVVLVAAELAVAATPATGRAAIARAAKTPITNTAQAAEGDAPVLEGVVASLVVVGREPGDRAFAAGVMAWLDWIVGLQPLPRWLR